MPADAAGEHTATGTGIRRHRDSIPPLVTRLWIALSITTLKPKNPILPPALTAVLRVAIPLMVSTGLFSVTLFVDRTFLLWYDGTQMGASMAAGNVFWVSICIPVGITSMTGAIVSQYIGAGQPERVGRFLWQSVWMAIAFTPLMATVAYLGDDLFRWTGQDPSLWESETTYLRILLIGGVGSVLESGLSGFFSGTHRTATILWVSVVAAIINIVLDAFLIFGSSTLGLGDWLPAGGIAGAAVASVLSFCFKGFAYATILLSDRRIAQKYQTRIAPVFDPVMFRKLLFFGFPTGLMYTTEAGAFTIIVLQIGTLGDIPLRATTMAINFNMIAFIPLVGVSIAASVLIGQALTGGDRAATGMLADDEPSPHDVMSIARAAIFVAMTYSVAWAAVYWFFPSVLIDGYGVGDQADSAAAAKIAKGLLGYVALYIVADGFQLVTAGILRGAGDTWYVWAAGVTAATVAIWTGFYFEPPADGSGGDPLRWWWRVILGWIWLMASLMTIRFASGRWRTMRMV